MSASRVSLSSRFTRGVVAALSIPMLVTAVAGCGDGGTTPTAEESRTMTEPPTIAEGPPVAVNGGSAAMQAWAADVSAGNVGRLTEKCWKYPASYIADRYVGVDRTKLNEVLAAAPSPGQVGTTWESPVGTVIDNASSSEQYACPQVTLDGQEQFPADVVAHTAKRYILVEQGTPMNPADEAITGRGRPFGCGPAPSRGPYDDPAAADPNSLEVGEPRQRAHTEQWPVQAGSRVVFVEARLTHLCVRAVTTGGDPYADPGEVCGTHTYEATGTRAAIFVADGGMTCADAVALVDRYFDDPGLDRQGNTMSAMFDGWTCASPTAAAARLAGYSTQCTNVAKGVEIQLVPTS